MADTGAPFFLPYPLDTDLVRDGAADIEALAEAVALALENIPVTEKRIEAFTGSGNWTVPTGVTYAIAHMRGGGGGVGTSATAGNGVASSVDFASGLVSASGGARAPGYNLTNAAIAASANSGNGAAQLRNTNDANGVGGIRAEDGAYVVAGAAVTPAATIAVVVGAGGSAGTGGAAGGSGYVYIEYYEEV